MRLCEFLAGLTVSQGRRAGEPLTVLPWQRRFVRGAFAPGVQSAAVVTASAHARVRLRPRALAGSERAANTLPRLSRG